MSVIRATVVPATPATAPVTTAPAAADAELGSAFAALVDALGAELAASGTNTEDGTVEGDEQGATDRAVDTGMAAVAVLALAGAAALLSASMPVQAGAARPADAGTATLSTLPGDPPGRGEGIEANEGVDAEALVDGLVEDAVPSSTTQPSPRPVAAEPTAGFPLPDTGDGAAAPVGDAHAGDDVALAEGAPSDGLPSDASLATTAPPDAEPNEAVIAGPPTTSDAATGIGRPAGPTAAAPTAAAGSGDPATRVAAPALSEQIVEVLSPLRRGPDGTHQVALQLRPDELGEVLVDVRVRGNEISLSLRADLAPTADLLRESLAELRSELEAAGFRSGNLDVGSHAERRSEREALPVPPVDLASRARNAADHVPDPASPSGATGLDLRL